jgi:hypothetical protein
MKHTLKSLLITSVLTLPSAFGSNDLTRGQEGLDKDNSGGAVAQFVAPTARGLDQDKNLGKLSPDILDIIRGAFFDCPENKTLLIGFLPIKDLAAVASVNHALGDKTQVILRMLRDFIISRIIPAELRPQLTYIQQAMVKLLGEDPTAHYPLFVKKISKAVLILTKGKLLDPAVALCEKRATDPNASVKDIMIGAQILAELKYPDKAVKVYALIAQRADATVEDIIAIADALDNLGEAYKDRAAALHDLAKKKRLEEMVANDKSE